MPLLPAGVGRPGDFDPEAAAGPAATAAHRSADRSLLFPSLARSIVGGLVAIAVILSGIVAINILQRDKKQPSAPTAARKTAAASGKVPASSAPAAVAAPSRPASATASRQPKPATSTAPSSKPATAPSAKPAATASAPTTPVTRALTPAQAAALRIPLTVLNNSRIGGLATAAAGDFRAAGWTVAKISNTTYQPKVTTVYYLPGQEESARQLMRDEPRVSRMLPRLRALPGAGLTVVVTRDYTG